MPRTMVSNVGELIRACVSRCTARRASNINVNHRTPLGTESAAAEFAFPINIVPCLLYIAIRLFTTGWRVKTQEVCWLELAPARDALGRIKS